MNTKAYREWLKKVELLTRSQRKAVLTQLNAVESHDVIIDGRPRFAKHSIR
jgi:hypothetical protein